MSECLMMSTEQFHSTAFEEWAAMLHLPRAEPTLPRWQSHSRAGAYLLFTYCQSILVSYYVILYNLIKKTTTKTPWAHKRWLSGLIILGVKGRSNETQDDPNEGACNQKSPPAQLPFIFGSISANPDVVNYHSCSEQLTQPPQLTQQPPWAAPCCRARPKVSKSSAFICGIRMEKEKLR